MKRGAEAKRVLMMTTRMLTRRRRSVQRYDGISIVMRAVLKGTILGTEASSLECIQKKSKAIIKVWM